MSESGIGKTEDNRTAGKWPAGEDAALEELLLCRSCIDKAGIGIFRSDAKGAITYVNEYGCASLGYRKEELIGKRIYDIDPAISREKMLALQKILDDSGSVTHETVHRRKDGTTLPVEITANQLEFKGERYIISFVKDITERKRVEEELLLGRFCIDKAGIGIYQCDHTGAIFSVNEQACKSLGYSREELCALNVLDIDPEITRERMLELKEILDEKGTTTFLTTHRRRDGTTFPVEITSNHLDFQGKRYGISFVKDISERRSVEEELRRTHAELEFRVMERTRQLNELTWELSIAEERERRRIASELHDQVGHTLILSKMKLDSLSAFLAMDEFEVIRDEIRDHLRKSIEDVRSLTFQLSPPLLYEVGFEAAVEWLAEEFAEKYGFRADFRDDGKAKPLDEEARIALYQMVREFLMNIAKHAGADRVNISVEKALDRIKLSVSDNGKGIDPATSMRDCSRNGGFGLFNIRQRIEHMGGSLAIESEPGSGTRISLLLPLSQNGREAEK